MTKYSYLPIDAEIRHVGAARNKPSSKCSRYSTFRARRKELDASPIEFATCLETTGLLNTRGFPRHVLEHATKVLNGFAPSDSVDSQSFENRWRFGWCRASFASNRIAS